MYAAYGAELDAPRRAPHERLQDCETVDPPFRAVRALADFFIVSAVLGVFFEFARSASVASRHDDNCFNRIRKDSPAAIEGCDDVGVTAGQGAQGSGGVNCGYGWISRIQVEGSVKADRGSRGVEGCKSKRHSATDLHVNCLLSTRSNERNRAHRVSDGSRTAGHHPSE